MSSDYAFFCRKCNKSVRGYRYSPTHGRCHHQEGLDFLADHAHCGIDSFGICDSIDDPYFDQRMAEEEEEFELHKSIEDKVVDLQSCSKEFEKSINEGIERFESFERRIQHLEGSIKVINTRLDKELKSAAELDVVKEQNIDLSCAADVVGLRDRFDSIESRLDAIELQFKEDPSSILKLYAIDKEKEDKLNRIIQRIKNLESKEIDDAIFDEQEILRLSDRITRIEANTIAKLQELELMFNNLNCEVLGFIDLVHKSPYAQNIFKDTNSNMASKDINKRISIAEMVEICDIKDEPIDSDSLECLEKVFEKQGDLYNYHFIDGSCGTYRNQKWIVLSTGEE